MKILNSLKDSSIFFKHDDATRILEHIESVLKASRAGNNATKILIKTFRGKLFKKAFGRARRGKDISSFERQEKESGFNFLYNSNNGSMQSGHVKIDEIGLFKQIIKSGT